jgi:hypothetical protein
VLREDDHRAFAALTPGPARGGVPPPAAKALRRWRAFSSA